MKKIILPGVLTICIALGSVAVFAQKEKTDNKKIEKKESREIIIRNSDKDTKMKIEIDGDKVTVNGKPLSDYNDDDVTVIERDLRKGPNMLYMPKGGNRNFEFFGNDSEDSRPKTFLGVITEKASDGVKVNEVMKGSSAEKAGLKTGDVVTKVDEKNISNPDDLLDAIQSYKPNEEVKVYYKRDGKKNDVKVKLGERKETKRTFTFNSDNGFGNGQAYNFKMPPMPKMQAAPRTFFRYFKNDNVKLGVKVEDAPDNTGGKILSVEDGSAADKAGLKKDDVITEMDGEKVTNVDEVRSQLMDAADKENFNVKAKRNNTEMNFEIKIPKPVNSADL
ncbi:MAG: PDZ domain-containing protein [Ginsengibacter sp.]